MFGDLLVEDEKHPASTCDKRLNRTARPSPPSSDIHIERTREELTVIVQAPRGRGW
jgi:hypothetical protein